MNVISLKNGAWKFVFENVNDADIFASRLQEIAVECHNMVTEKPEEGFEDYQGDVSEMAITFAAKRKMVGEVGALPGEYFSTVRELANYVESRDHARVKGMKDSIKNLNDLLAFPLDHCFCGEEYTDYDAIKAYKERTFELTGIHLGDFEEEMER